MSTAVQDSRTNHVLDIRSLSKSYPGQRALDDARLTVRSGQIHALLGQNGSGKSTLIKVLAGFHKPDPGADVHLFGGTVHYDGSGVIDQERVRVMHQDLGLVGSLDVVENLALGRGFSARLLGRIRWSAERRRAEDLLAGFGVELDARRQVADLSPAESSIVGLARAMQDWDPDGGLLVLDEPTATLPGSEVARLAEAVRRVAARGAGILFVTHRLDEVLELADWVTVLRDGRTVASRTRDGLDHDDLVQLIVGRPVTELYAEATDLRGDPVVVAEGLWGDLVEDLALTVREGELVGFAGLVGSGREEVGGLLGGVRRPADGTLRVGPTAIGGDPRRALAAGLAYVPADRKNEGLIQSASVSDNITLGRLGDLVSGVWLGARRPRAEAARWIHRVDLRPDDPDRPMSTLSGGNQQKAVLARVLRGAPRAVVLDEPTQGVDVGAKSTIYALLADAARAGTAVVICSSDAEELAGVCDRVVVLRRGRIAAELSNERLTVDAIVEQTLR